MEQLDFFHAESWGLVQIHAPKDVDYLDRLVEEDEQSEEESDDASPEETLAPESKIPSDQIACLQPDVFALVLKPVPKTIVVPGLLRASRMNTQAQMELVKDMETAGGPLGDRLKELLLSRGRQHADEVREEVRALARMNPQQRIFWITEEPKSITIYRKPHMSMARRLDWIRWKANELSIELTLPVFMALFKQMSIYPETPTGNKTRLQQFKLAVGEWRNEALDWKELPEDERHLIQNINEGKMDCYCRSCRRVLDPKSKSEFCGVPCASKFCRDCGTQLHVRLVTDDERLELERRRIGPYRHLFDLAEILSYREQVEACRSLADLAPRFQELEEKRRTQKCCEGVDGFVDKRWCKRCIVAFEELEFVRRSADRILSGDVTWGHCMEAKARLERMAHIPIPKKEERFCAEPSCSISCKRKRVS